MDEDVGGAVIGGDKTVALVRVEPFHGSLSHLLSPSRDEPGIRAPCADQLLAARHRRKNPPAQRNAHCQNRGRLQRSLTSTTTFISSTFTASLFPPSAQLRPVRSLTGRAGPARRAPQTRSEQAGVHQHRPEPSDPAAPGGEPKPACVITHRGQSSEQPRRRIY